MSEPKLLNKKPFPGAEPLSESPAKFNARTLIQLFANGNVGNTLVKDCFQELYEKFGDQSQPCPEAQKHMRAFYRKHKELSGPLREITKPFKTSHPIHFENQAELYPAGHRRTEGPEVKSVADVMNHKTICSYDVLQQTPEVLDLNIDQQHVVTGWKPTASNLTPDAMWTTKIPREVIFARDDLLCTIKDTITQVYKITEEDITLELEKTLSVHVDDSGVIIGCNDIYGMKGIATAKNASRKFRRTGIFDQTILPTRGDSITPKVDGEALYVFSIDGVGKAVDRVGNNWSFESGTAVRILVECVPSIAEVEHIYLTHVWRLGIVNNVGIVFSKELLKRKNIKIAIGGKLFPLEFPTFSNRGIPFDGYVLHRGRSQYFFKKEPTIDVFHRRTQEKIQETFGGKLVVQWIQGKNEYTVKWKDDKLYITYLRKRYDKIYENEFFNILEICNAPPIESWQLMFEENEVEVL